jgi:hypothetical protein
MMKPSLFQFLPSETQSTQFHQGKVFSSLPPKELNVRGSSIVYLLQDLQGLSSVRRVDLTRRIRLSHGRCGIVLHLVYQ